MRVSPFGHLRIIAHLQLPAAFRSLSRPSSAPGAKASALRPNSLDQLLFDLYGSRLLFSLELVVFPTVMRSLPHVPRSFPGAIIFRYLCDNASIRFPILRVHRILSNLIHSARLSYMRFSRCVCEIFSHSGDEGIRTPDPLLARQVLSQLSYTPIHTLNNRWA